MLFRSSRLDQGLRAGRAESLVFRQQRWIGGDIRRVAVTWKKTHKESKTKRRYALSSAKYNYMSNQTFIYIPTAPLSGYGFF